MDNLVKEFRRRNVFRVGGGYAVIGWLLIQLGIALETTLVLPQWFDSAVTICVLIGFPIALILSWLYEVTPDGIKTTQSTKEDAPAARKFGWIDLSILIGLLVMLFVSVFGLKTVYGTGEIIARDPIQPVVDAPPDARLATVPWIEVAPIRILKASNKLSALSAALTDDITTSLSRFPYLNVAGQGEAAPGTGPRYVLDGTLQDAGETLRLSMQLTDSVSGAKVWGSRFDRRADENELGLQDDLTDHVVASVADPYGALMRELSAPVLRKSHENLTAYEAVLRFFIYNQRISPEDHLATRAILEQAAKRAPDNANVWSVLALIYLDEYKHAHNTQPNARDRALDAAYKAIALEPDNAYAHFILAEVHFFRQDIGAFKAAAERSMALNSRDSESLAMIGIMHGYTGDWEKAVKLTSRAMEINPTHPGWYWFAHFMKSYKAVEYQSALDYANKVNMPGYYADAYTRAAAHAQLGHEQEAAAAIDDLLALWPHSLEDLRTLGIDNWMYAQPGLANQIVQGLQKAGLDIE